MTDYLYQWMDLIWLPIAFFIVHKHQRIKVFAFILTCIMTLRLQVGIMESIDMDGRDGTAGLLTWMDYHVYHRGLIVYGIFISFFLAIARFSPRSKAAVMLAAMISIYMIAFCASMLLMVF